MKSTNPMFRHNDMYEQTYALAEKPMTISGTMNKLLLLSIIMLISVAGVYYQFSLGRYDFISMAAIGGVIISLALAMILWFKPNLAQYIAPLYALAQGAVISAISCVAEAKFPGIVIQAVSVTFLVVVTMALLFKTGLIVVNEKFRATIIIGTIAIGIFYLISFVLMLCGINVPYFSVNSPLTITVNALIACFAAFNLIVDFDFIEKGERNLFPASYEWYGAFGLLVTILWLYIEILRLLSRLASRNN